MKTEFGDYLVLQIKEAKMSQEEFYNEVGIKKPYFYDILTAAPPVDLQNRMLKVLDDRTGVNEIRRNKFYDLAAADRNEIPADISMLIMKHSHELDKIRDALITLFDTIQ